MNSTTWQNYEEVAQYLLNKFAEHFNIGLVEGKQIIPDKKSGTIWRIDAKGMKDDEEGFLIIECRRYTTSRLNQESMAALAYKILNTEAQGGIIVSPLGLQTGAKKVAEASHIESVILDAESTTTEYIMKFLNRIFIGLSDPVESTDCLNIRITPGKR